MPNPLIELAAGPAGVQQFELLLHEPNKVFFLVLGGSDDHKQLAKAAEQHAKKWRHAVWAPTPEALYPRLLSLKLRPGVLPILGEWPPTIYAISISVNNYICRIANTPKTTEIAPAFILAETFMQP